jgi:protein-L-isoaspartate(D-aspartate) O-methyltransferase
MIEAFVQEREEMVTNQIERRGITSPRVLEAMRSVPRHKFVPPDMVRYAYDDNPLPIGSSQTISQPYIVALMTQLLALTGAEIVLEIGTGSGYQAAILGSLAREVHTIERHPDLADRARNVLAELGFKNVFVHIGDGTLGWQDASPYQGIIITAAAPGPPPPVLDQLSDGGRMVIPVGAWGSQMLQLLQKEKMAYSTIDVLPVAFVPLRGEHGWKE